jgi:hypothetical protein
MDPTPPSGGDQACPAIASGEGGKPMINDQIILIPQKRAQTTHRD